MKFKYDRPSIKIENWVVTLDDLRHVYDFLKDRFGVEQVRIELETREGNNREYDNFKELLADVPRLSTDGEVVTELHISYRAEDKKDWRMFKQAWITLKFGEYSNAYFHIVAGDTDGSYRDWVAGTYEQMKSMAQKFEIKDKRVALKLESKGHGTVVFDPHEELLSSIKRELEREDENERKYGIVTLPSGKKVSFRRWVKPEFLIPTAIAAFSIPWWPFLLHWLFG